MKNLKKVLCFMFIAILCFQMKINAKAEEQEKQSLKDMSAEECLEVLVENGLVIPEGYKNYPELENFVKGIVDSVIETPERRSWFNFTKAEEFALLIREAVLAYEGINDYNRLNREIMTLSYGYENLIYSTFVNWIESYASFNCYAYAINKVSTGAINPGYMIGVEYDSTTVDSMTVSRMASLVSYDLQALGYTNITYGTSLLSAESGYRIIALRKGAGDYHFMHMYSSEPVWRHKPGKTAVLKYNYSSLTSGKWTNEGILRDVYYAATVEYDSDIVYIKYKQ